MSINQITNANTFGQLITAVSAMIAVANNLTDGPEVHSNSTWTFTNPGVGINVGNTAIINTANVSNLNLSQANVTNETVGRSNISTANVTVANITGATVTNLNTTNYATANANVSVLLQVSDRANIFSANIENANIGTVAITSLTVTSLTVPVLNASFANVTTLSVTGTSQHNALVATLLTSTNANVGLLNASTANITQITFGTTNTSVSNTTTANVVVLNAGFANIISSNIASINTELANISTANVLVLNAGFANVISANLVTINVGSANLALGFMVANPTTNLAIATKHYVDTGAGQNLVNKITYAAKGDLIPGTGANTFAVLSTGSNGQSLVVDTNQATGLRWANRAAGTFRGLTMHSSMADKVANGTQIIVRQLDETVMDDGEVVSNWTLPSTIDLSVSGAGGIDGGTANANTWYEVYAIRKRVDGTKNFMLHRALDRKSEQNTFFSTYWPITTGLGANNTSNLYIKLAQSFTPNVTGNLASLEIRVFKTSTPTGNMWLTIEANTAGSPSGTTLCTSRKMDVSRVPVTTPCNARFIFDNTAVLTAGTSYFWIFNSDYAGSATAFINVAYSASSQDLYSNTVNRGLPYGNTGGAWANIQGSVVGTFPYKTFMEANNVSVTMPTGYDQKCLIGYVATDSSSKLKEFHQKERTITTYPSPQWVAVGSVQIANPEVIDFGLTASIPPIPCTVSFFATCGSLNTYGIGRFQALDLVGTTTSNADLPAGFVLAVASYSTTAGVSPPIWIEHQAALAKFAVANTRLYPVSITF